jgi:hypothetical protein
MRGLEQVCIVWAMDRTEFWRLIESTRKSVQGDLEELVKALREKLQRLPTTEIEDYARIFGELMTESYDWRLWGAAYVINGWCSDDGFDYFRAWLIAQGEKVYSQALLDPDSLADVIEEDVDADFEEMLYPAVEAYEAKTGEELDDPNPARSGYTSDPRGVPWKEEDLPRLYPRLTKARASE